MQNDRRKEEEEEEARIEQEDIPLFPRSSRQDGDQASYATADDTNTDANCGLWNKAWRHVELRDMLGQCDGRS